ncbi:uncharacterized protein EV420DRAFT_1483496 [Desarmillaria tabescens]|uniref:Uncharacterized protein n=1 Tax=Armillaria tabescens TaxID=1929756 RepID=A0AA39MV58_ARMTA|nr:uncharacterized protein EV420DRAFT_1483496 [Desarmillaria tabescens]KAK0448246.1 hypothetical protein EV420DRAFT_1483496 [Desarmillaria tabescens]
MSINNDQAQIEWAKTILPVYRTILRLNPTSLNSFLFGLFVAYTHQFWRPLCAKLGVLSSDPGDTAKMRLWKRQAFVMLSDLFLRIHHSEPLAQLSSFATSSNTPSSSSLPSADESDARNSTIILSIPPQPRRIKEPQKQGRTTRSTVRNRLLSVIESSEAPKDILTSAEQTDTLTTTPATIASARAPPESDENTRSTKDDLTPTGDTGLVLMPLKSNWSRTTVLFLAILENVTGNPMKSDRGSDISQSCKTLTNRFAFQTELVPEAKFLADVRFPAAGVRFSQQIDPSSLLSHLRYTKTHMTQKTMHPKAFSPEQERFLREVLMPQFVKGKLGYLSVQETASQCFQQLREAFPELSATDEMQNIQKKVGVLSFCDRFGLTTSSESRKCFEKNGSIIKKGRKRAHTLIEHYMHTECRENRVFKVRLDKEIRKAEEEILKARLLAIGGTKGTSRVNRDTEDDSAVANKGKAKDNTKTNTDPDTDGAAQTVDLKNTSQLITPGKMMQMKKRIAEDLFQHATPQVKAKIEELYGAEIRKFRDSRMSGKQTKNEEEEEANEDLDSEEAILSALTKVLGSQEEKETETAQDVNAKTATADAPELNSPGVVMLGYGAGLEERPPMYVSPSQLQHHVSSHSGMPGVPGYVATTTELPTVTSLICNAALSDTPRVPDPTLNQFAPSLNTLLEVQPNEELITSWIQSNIWSEQWDTTSMPWPSPELNTAGLELSCLLDKTLICTEPMDTGEGSDPDTTFTLDAPRDLWSSIIQDNLDFLSSNPEPSFHPDDTSGGPNGSGVNSAMSGNTVYQLPLIPADEFSAALNLRASIPTGHADKVLPVSLQDITTTTTGRTNPVPTQHIPKPPQQDQESGASSCSCGIVITLNNVSQHIVQAQAIFRTSNLGATFNACVNLWLKFEQCPDIPNMLSEYLSARNLQLELPDMSVTHKYTLIREILCWWNDIQPERRQTSKGYALPIPNYSFEFSTLKKKGPHGMVQIMEAMRWWGTMQLETNQWMLFVQDVTACYVAMLGDIGGDEGD